MYAIRSYYGNHPGTEDRKDSIERPVDALLEELGTAPIKEPVRLAELLKRPEVTIESLKRIAEDFPVVDAKVEAAIEATKAFLQLSHDVGGAGVKVKPDRFHEGVPRVITSYSIHYTKLYEGS